MKEIPDAHVFEVGDLLTISGKKFVITDLEDNVTRAKSVVTGKQKNFSHGDYEVYRLQLMGVKENKEE